MCHHSHIRPNFFELIIVDDGSTDPEVKKILKDYANDARVVLVQQKANGGQSRAINAGALRVKGDYFCRLDSDDKLMPNALAVLTRYIQQFSKVSYFYREYPSNRLTTITSKATKKKYHMKFFEGNPK